MATAKAVETRRKEPRANRDGQEFMEHKNLGKLREFCENDAVKQFRKFHAAVVARCVSYLYPDGDAKKTPNFHRVQGVNLLLRSAVQVANRAAEGVGMTAKIDTGQRTRTHGRVLEVGSVLAIAPVLWRGKHARNRLRMIRPDGRTVERLVRIMRVHRLSERSAE